MYATRFHPNCGFNIYSWSIQIGGDAWLAAEMYALALSLGGRPCHLTACRNGERGKIMHSNAREVKKTAKGCSPAETVVCGACANSQNHFKVWLTCLWITSGKSKCTLTRGSRSLSTFNAVYYHNTGLLFATSDGGHESGYGLYDNGY